MSEPANDLDHWSRALAERLAGHDDVFQALEEARQGKSKLSSEEIDALGISHDGSDVIFQYARVVSRLLEALSGLPGFEDGRGLLTLTMLRFDLVALDEGSRPERLHPPRRETKQGTPAPRRSYQAQVIECVILLEELGQSGYAARQSVADIFAKHGHRGSYGDRLSPDTLTRWREAVMAPDGPYLAGRRMIERKLKRFKSEPGWPPSLEDALAYIERRARDRVISLAASK
jgi:hypothetical protein